MGSGGVGGLSSPKGTLGEEGTTPGMSRAIGTPRRERILGIEGTEEREAGEMSTGAAAVKDAKATAADTMRVQKEGMFKRNVGAIENSEKLCDERWQGSR